MRIALINHVLMLATKHQNVNTAIMGRGDKGVSLLHVAHKLTGRQQLFSFRSQSEIRELEKDPRIVDSTMFLGFYTVPEATWSLANLANVYERLLLEKKGLSKETLGTFSEQLVEKLIMSSTSLNSPSAAMPEDHELWRLCLTGDNQEVFVPSDTEGTLSMLPGEVLADFSAPKGMPSAIVSLLAKERELEHLKEEAHEALRQLVGSLFSTILGELHENEPEDDSGFRRSFGIN